ncbi:MAG: ABC transporter permease, partial [Desulfosalsimonas sp.]
MIHDPDSQNACFDIREDAKGTLAFFFRGKLDISTAPQCLKYLSSSVKSKKTPELLIIDLGGVTRMDDYGAMVILRLIQKLSTGPEGFRLENAGEDHSRILSLVDFGQPECSMPSRRQDNIIVQLGDSTIKSLKGTSFFIEFIGAIVFACAQAVKHPGSFRINDAIRHMQTTGVHALPVVGLISFLLGLIIAFMSSLQLSQFGANIYVASLVGLAMVSELGPIMTAIIVAGRSGSA